MPRLPPPSPSARRPSPLRSPAPVALAALVGLAATGPVARAAPPPSPDADAPVAVPGTRPLPTPPSWFPRHPTDQLGVPGDIETGELTPNGALFTGRLEATVLAGRAMRPWSGGPRKLDAEGLPIYRWSSRVDGVDVRATAFAVRAAGVPVVHLRVAAVNPTGRRRPFAVGLDVGWLGAGLSEALDTERPRASYRFPRNVASAGAGLFEQPGEAFDPAWTSAWAGQVLLRSGSPLLRARMTGQGAQATRTTSPAPTQDAVSGRLRASGSLRPRSSRALEVVVPLRAVPVGHPALEDRFDDAQRRLRAAWRPVLRRGMRLSTPEPALDRAWKAGILAMLVPRRRLEDGRWVQNVNKFQYQASWIRDTAMISHALDLLGFDREAGENVAFLPRWQADDGLLQSRDGQFDGMGQALWSFGDHVARSRDLVLAERLLPVADAAVDWVRRRLEADPRWILPPSDPRDDNEHLAGHSAGDLLWLAGGVRRVVALARVLGDDERVTRWSAVADEVGRVARARVSEAAVAGVVPPVLDATGGRRWGEQWMTWPTAVFGAREPLVTTTMAAARRDEREGLALWGAGLHLYLGLRRLHTELRAGRPAQAITGLYAVLAHLSSTGGTWEQSSAPYGSRALYGSLGPHAWASADLASLVHDMLVRDEGDGLRILGALPPAWLRRGAVTRVRGAATERGRVDLELRATTRGATLRWDADVAAGTPLRFRVPPGVTGVRLPGAVPGDREIRLPRRRGTLALRWTVPPRLAAQPDAETVRTRLQAAYRARGRR